MSRAGKEWVSYRSCHNNQTIPVWDSINVVMNPSSRVSLINGEIDLFKGGHFAFKPKSETRSPITTWKENFGSSIIPLKIFRAIPS